MLTVKLISLDSPLVPPPTHGGSRARSARLDLANLYGAFGGCTARHLSRSVSRGLADPRRTAAGQHGTVSPVRADRVRLKFMCSRARRTESEMQKNAHDDVK